MTLNLVLDKPAANDCCTDGQPPCLRIETVGFGERETLELRKLLVAIGQQLTLRLEPDTLGADILLLEIGHALQMPPGLVKSTRGDRPTLLVVGAELRNHPGRERERSALLHQFESLPLVRRVLKRA